MFALLVTLDAVVAVRDARSSLHVRRPGGHSVMLAHVGLGKAVDSAGSPVDRGQPEVRPVDFRAR